MVRWTLIGVILVGLTLGGAPAQALEAPQKVAVVFFKPKAVNLDRNAKDVLNAIVPGLGSVRAIRVDGFVQQDRTGAKRPGLSKRRADAVARYLSTEFRKRGWQVSIVSEGKGRPPDNPNSPWSRRAEVFVTAMR